MIFENQILKGMKIVFSVYLSEILFKIIHHYNDLILGRKLFCRYVFIFNIKSLENYQKLERYKRNVVKNYTMKLGGKFGS